MALSDFKFHRVLGAGVPYSVAGAALGFASGPGLAAPMRWLSILVALMTLYLGSRVAGALAGPAARRRRTWPAGAAWHAAGLVGILAMAAYIELVARPADATMIVTIAVAGLGSAMLVVLVAAADAPPRPAPNAYPAAPMDGGALVAAVLASSGGLLLASGGASAGSAEVVGVGLMVAFLGGGAAAASALGARAPQAVAVLAFALVPLGAWLGVYVWGAVPVLIGFACGASMPHVMLANAILRRSEESP